MDWGRAKTYFILTFLVLNLLLFYEWYVVNGQAASSVESFAHQLHDIREVLQSRHLVIDTVVPQGTPELGSLQVEYATPPKNVAKQALFETDVEGAAYGSSKPHNLENGSGQFQTVGPSTFHVVWQPPVGVVNVNDPHIFTSIIQQISPNVWYISHFVGDYVVRQSDTDIAVNYTQQYNSYPIFSTNLTVHVNEGHITGYDQTVLSILGEDKDTTRTVLSAISALHALADTMDNESDNGDNHHITDIRLGYYSLYSASKWYLSPMWRIVTDEGIYYVNAFTGEVQQG